MPRTKKAPKLYLEGKRYRISLTYFGSGYKFSQEDALARSSQEDDSVIARWLIARFSKEDS